jgi:hypothetical protein
MTVRPKPIKATTKKVQPRPKLTYPVTNPSKFQKLGTHPTR